MGAGGPFCVLAFEHPLRAVESVAQAMAGGLRALGVDARVIVLPRDHEALGEALRAGPCGVLSLGPVPLATVRVDGQPLHRAVRCRVWLWFLDAPIYDLARVPTARDFLEDSLADPRLVPVFPERGHAALLGGAAWGPQACHVPFGAFPRLEPGSPPPDRQRRLCVIGTVGSELGGAGANEPLPALLRRCAPDAAAPDLDALAHRLLAPDAPAVPLQAVMASLRWSARDVLAPGALAVACAVDSWVKRARRLAAVDSLRGLPVDFFGSGWREAFPDERTFRQLGTLRHDDIGRAAAHYAALVNFDPNWSGGVHDRVYTACAMGVPAITNANDALQEAGLPEDLLHPYDANRPGLAASARSCLEAAAGPAVPRPEVIGRHGWSARMADLLG